MTAKAMDRRRETGAMRTHVFYTAGVAREICERIARGESWRAMAGTGRMPSVNTLAVWRRRHPVFAEALAQAREVAREIRLTGRLAGRWPEIFERLQVIQDEEPKSTNRCRPQRRKPVDRNGRKTYVRYGEAVAEAICAQLAEGRTISSFCNTPGMPSHRTFYLWRDSRPEFAAAVEAAQRMAAETRFERALDVAMASSHDTVRADQLKVATLMTHAAKLHPDRFGRGGPRGGRVESPVRQIVIREFSLDVREDGSRYVRAIDSVQDVEDGR